MTPEEYLQQSINLLQNQRLEEAVNLLAEGRAHFPKFAALAANHAVALRKLDRQDEAGEALKTACELEPNNSQILFNFANWFFDQGLFDEAELRYREALRVQPELGPAALRLARIIARRGDWKKALPHFITALRNLPQNKQCLELFIKFINEQCPVEGRLQRMRQAGDQALQNGLLQTAIGVSEYSDGNFDEAEKRAKTALSVPNPEVHDAANLMAVLMQARGDFQEAIQILRQVLSKDPNNVSCLCNLGTVLKRAGHPDRALEVLKKAIQVDPKSVTGHANKAAVYNVMKKPGDAEIYARKALELDEQNHDALVELGLALINQGEIDASLNVTRKALEVSQKKSIAASNLLYVLNFSGTIPDDEVAREHLEWGRKYFESVQQFELPDRKHEEGRRLRIGYLSPDFKAHSVAIFLEPLMSNHDREKFHVTCYSATERSDVITPRFKELSDEWRNVMGMSEQKICELIQNDEIDILFDLAGHTSGNRLDVFARKPAPLQISWLGFPNTTGLPNMDYYITDHWCDPLGVGDEKFSEKLWRMDRLKFAAKPPLSYGDMTPLPAKKNGFVTFGCFNNPMKYNEKVTEYWTQLINSVPNSRLLLKAKLFTDQKTREHFLQRFESHGLDADRLILKDFSMVMDDIDIALDPFPFNGATTTFHALWMGLPVITFKGDSHRARVASAILESVGLADQCVGETPEDAIEKARKLAYDIDALSELRNELRQRIDQSPIRDGKDFAEKFEAALMEMWKIRLS